MLGPSKQEELARRYADDETVQMVKKAFDKDLVEAFQEQFKRESKVSSAAIYVDIAGFSRKVDGLSPKAVREFLDGFYNVAIPLIYKHGGKIDRIAADGIIAIYSSFFIPNMSTKTAEEIALSCAQAIVGELFNSEHAAKAAVSSGELLFCKTGVAEVYEDFTVIGTPLTELYRLEDMAEANQVVLRGDTDLGQRVWMDVKLQDAHRAVQRLKGLPVSIPSWLVKKITRKLRGVSNDQDVEVLIESCAA